MRISGVLVLIVNPLKLFNWTFRRNEKDVINLYDTLSDVMRLATGGDMLNFGYWHKNTANPLEAQTELCNILAKLADLQTAKRIVDVGSGFSAPSIQWKRHFTSLEITCININFNQLRESLQILRQKSPYSDLTADEINLLNATSTSIPLEDETVDRVMVLESAHHMKPFDNFVAESRRILKNDGILALAIPVACKKKHMTALGILSMTWSSERYSTDYIKSSLASNGFDIKTIQKIGPMVYQPLVNYYTRNRESIKKAILSKYPSYMENILFKSLLKMKDVSEKNIIDYILIKCKKN